MLDIIIISLIVGLVYSFFSIGLAISFRVLNYPDLTIEGSLLLGGAVFFFFSNAGFPIALCLFFAIIGGFIAGVFSAYLHTNFKVNKLLSGIITSAILYSINIRLMEEKSNVPIPEKSRIFINDLPLTQDFSTLLILVIIISSLLFFLTFLFKTKVGYYLRTLGDNPNFLESLGKNSKKYLLFGLGISNSVIALGGAILVQYKGVSDINYSFGILISSLAAILLGDLLLNSKTLLQVFTSNILGTICYALIISIIMFNWSDSWQEYILASDVRFFTGLLLLLPLLISRRLNQKKYKLFNSEW